jgi:hypothetical protein
MREKFLYDAYLVPTSVDKEFLYGHRRRLSQSEIGLSVLVGCCAAYLGDMKFAKIAQRSGMPSDKE